MIKKIVTLLFFAFALSGATCSEIPESSPIDETQQEDSFNDDSSSQYQNDADQEDNGQYPQTDGDEEPQE